MRKVIFIFLVLILFTGCKTSKSLDLEDKTVSATETEKKETVRQGDTTSLYMPYNIRHKDTTIYSYSYETKQLIRETYDEQGNRQTDCISDELREMVERTKTLIENSIALSEQKTTEFNPAGLIWAIVALAAVMLLALIFGMFAFMSLKKAIPGIVADAVAAAVNK